MRLIIWCGVGANIILLLFAELLVAIPSPVTYVEADSFNAVFTFVPRIIIASIAAFIVGSFTNAYVMSRMKVASQGKSFSFRAIVSTVIGETIDSLIFFFIAFSGILSIVEIFEVTMVQIMLKSMYEIAILPFTVRIVKYLKRKDGIDVYDNDISYNVLKIRDM
jgi:uncharacterized integral membrane protein (TIGR00697 family)